MMGLGDVELLKDGGGGGVRAKGTPVAVSCSICLEAVTDNGERSSAKLQCGHQFHLDCIGSAFNSKGAMQCPNCRKIEKGQWLFANGSRSQPDLIMEEWPWPPEEDLYDISFSEMSFGVHWCPFSGLTRLPSSPDEGEFSSSSHNDPFWQRTSFFEHTPGSSTNAPCPPFITYLGPIRASSSISSGNISDGPNLRNLWTGPSNQPSVASATQRTARSNVDMPRPASFVHPVLVSHSSASRAPSSVTLPAIPPYSPYSSSFSRGSRDRARGYYQQQSNNNPTARSSVGPHRGSAQVPPVTSTSDQSNGFYFFSSGRNFPEAEQPVPSRYNPWEREHPPSFQVNRESIWGPFYPTASGRQRHGSERVLSQHR